MKLPLIISKALRSKTLLLGYAMVALGAAWDNADLVRQLLPPEWAGKGVAALGLVVAVLRVFTSKPLDDK